MLYFCNLILILPTDDFLASDIIALLGLIKSWQMKSTGVHGTYGNPFGHLKSGIVLA